mmetsp:Transcript_24619/g.38027  ORF Transcript_24619/g.38027 Transcript_24619/m.38027 type:complete len:530 (+) Transcript_24619:759-2348(+)
MGGSILTNSNGIVRQDVRNAVQLRQRCHTDGGTEVVHKHRKGRSRDLEQTVVSKSVQNGSHGMLTDSKVQILVGVALIKSGTKVASIVDVVAARSVQIGRSTDVVGHELGNLLDDLVSRYAGGLSCTSHLGDGIEHFFRTHHLVVDGIVELGGELGVGLRPGLEGIVPCIVRSLVLGLDLGKELACALANVPLLTIRQSNVLLGVVHVWHASLTVCGIGTLSLLHSFTNNGVALDELGLAVIAGLGGGDGGLHGLQIMSVDLVRLPSVGLVTLDDVLALGVLGHLVQGHLVAIVQNDQVIELFVCGKGCGFRADSLLEASISSQHEDVVVEDLVVGSVVHGGGHLGGGGMSHGVGYSSSQGTGGALDSGGGMLAVGELGVSGGLGMVLTELLELVNAEVESSEVEPGVKEHGSVSGGEDEAVAVDPGGVLGVVGHLASVKGGSNLTTSEGKTHVTRVSGSNGVHGQTTSLIGSGGERSEVGGLSSGAHLKAGGLARNSAGEGNRLMGGESISRRHKGSKYGDSRELHYY